MKNRILKRTLLGLTAIDFITFEKSGYDLHLWVNGKRRAVITYTSEQELLNDLQIIKNSRTFKI